MPAKSEKQKACDLCSQPCVIRHACSTCTTVYCSADCQALDAQFHGLVCQGQDNNKQSTSSSKIGKCFHCLLKPATQRYTCQKCAAPYCSKDCQLKDTLAHVAICENFCRSQERAKKANQKAADTNMEQLLKEEKEKKNKKAKKKKQQSKQQSEKVQEAAERDNIACEFCTKPSHARCACPICNTLYCSAECQTQDAQFHRQVCEGAPVVNSNNMGQMTTNKETTPLITLHPDLPTDPGESLVGVQTPDAQLHQIGEAVEQTTNNKEEEETTLIHALSEFENNTEEQLLHIHGPQQQEAQSHAAGSVNICQTVCETLPIGGGECAHSFTVSSELKAGIGSQKQQHTQRQSDMQFEELKREHQQLKADYQQLDRKQQQLERECQQLKAENLQLRADMQQLKKNGRN